MAWQNQQGLVPWSGKKQTEFLPRKSFCQRLQTYDAIALLSTKLKKRTEDFEKKQKKIHLEPIKFLQILQREGACLI
jgi:hypothetical protein